MCPGSTWPFIRPALAAPAGGLISLIATLTAFVRSRYKKDSTSTGGHRMGIISWIVLGLIAGVLAKLIMPGRDPGGIIVTILIGIAGAIVGGFLFSLFGGGGVSGVNLGALIVAVIGGLVLLCVYRLFVARRGSSSY